MKNNTQLIDLTGQRFGRWTVIEQAEPGEGFSTRWLCECDCGRRRTVSSQLLRSGRSRSCGCLRDEMMMQGGPNGSKTDSITRLKKIWFSICRACEDKHNPRYAKFGAKGIKMCKEWRSNYHKFANWSFANGYRADTFLLRFDKDQDYAPWNCHWTDEMNKGQGRKGSIMLTANGETHSMAEWSRITGLHRSSIEERLLRGATPEEAVSPIRQPKGRKKNS